MFNQEEFANLLIEAKGKNRSMRQYAAEVGISHSYLSQFINKLKTSPPTPDTLRKLASCADNGVTMKALMRACGHFEEPKGIRDDRHGKMAEFLFRKSGGWSYRIGTHADYELLNPQGEVWEWVENGIPEEVYGRLAMMPKTTNKRSIVTSSKTEAEILLNNPPYSLQGTYSIILVEDDDWEEFFFPQ